MIPAGSTGGFPALACSAGLTPHRRGWGLRQQRKGGGTQVSQYAFGGWQPFKLGDLRAGGMVGLVNGYS